MQTNATGVVATGLVPLRFEHWFEDPYGHAYLWWGGVFLFWTAVVLSKCVGWVGQLPADPATPERPGRSASPRKPFVSPGVPRQFATVEGRKLLYESLHGKPPPSDYHIYELPNGEFAARFVADNLGRPPGRGLGFGFARKEGDTPEEQRKVPGYPAHVLLATGLTGRGAARSASPPRLPPYTHGGQEVDRSTLEASALDATGTLVLNGWGTWSLKLNKGDLHSTSGGGMGSPEGRPRVDMSLQDVQDCLNQAVDAAAIRWRALNPRPLQAVPHGPAPQHGLASHSRAVVAPHESGAWVAGGRSREHQQ